MEESDPTEKGICTKQEEMEVEEEADGVTK
jgi:hypothetical protein